MLTHAEVVLDRDELRNVTLDDRQLMRQILGALIDDANRHAATLEHSARENDAARVMRVARYAARACANLGANASAAAFRTVERHAASRDFEACRSQLPAVRVQIDRLREESARI